MLVTNQRVEAVKRSKHLVHAGQRLPMLGKLLSFSGKSSLQSTGSARCSTTFRGIVPKTDANLLMHSDLGTKTQLIYFKSRIKTSIYSAASDQLCLHMMYMDEVFYLFLFNYCKVPIFLKYIFLYILYMLISLVCIFWHSLQTLPVHKICMT